jgi:hypothetical protein
MYKKSLKIPKEVTRRCKMKERKHTVQKKERGVLKFLRLQLVSQKTN